MLVVSTEQQSKRPQLLLRCTQGRRSPVTHGPAGLHLPALRTEAEPRLPGPTPRCSSGLRGSPACQALLALDWDTATLQEEPENPACDFRAASSESDRTLQTCDLRAGPCRNGCSAAWREKPSTALSTSPHTSQMLGQRPAGRGTSRPAALSTACTCLWVRTP